MKRNTYIELTKNMTLPDAEYPQEDKYPSNKFSKRGIIIQEVNVGVSFIMEVDESNLKKKFGTIRYFKTSPVKSIIESTPTKVVFKTNNSIYTISSTFIK